MYKLNGNLIVYCDVDNTLVLFGLPDDENTIVLFENQIECRIRPNKKIIEKLKEHKLRGHTVVVWSQGGVDWAETVVKQLNLQSVVDVVMTKPTWFIDDLSSNEFMGDDRRYYYGEK